MRRKKVNFMIGRRRPWKHPLMHPVVEPNMCHMAARRAGPTRSGPPPAHSIRALSLTSLVHHKMPVARRIITLKMENKLGQRCPPMFTIQTAERRTQSRLLKQNLSGPSASAPSELVISFFKCVRGRRGIVPGHLPRVPCSIWFRDSVRR